MKSNKHVKRKLSAYLDGELNEAGRRQVRAHLHSCDACAEEERNLRQILKTLDILPEADAQPFLYTRIRSRLDAGERNQGSEIWQRFLIPFSSAAVIVLGIFFGSQLTSPEPGARSQSAEEWLGVLELDSFADFPDDSFSRIYFESEPADGSEGGAP